MNRVDGAPAQRPTLEKALAGRSNAFGLLRLVLASMVIFNHAFPLGDFGEDPTWNLTRGQASLGSFAVLGFFAVSGYLIAKSAARLDILQYFWHRALRIFPAYWTALVAGAFIVGPVVWWLSGKDLGTYVNFHHGGPVHYVWANSNLTIENYGVHDIFATTTPYGRLVGSSVLNGSIWTLIYEWRMYVVVALLALVGLMARNRVVLLMCVGGLGAIQLAEIASPGMVDRYLPVLNDPQLLVLSFVFLVGSTFAAYRDRIVFDHRLGVFSILVVLGTLHYGGFPVFGHVAAVYAVLYLAAALPAPFQRIGAVNDYSYGIYVYGFLVQQTLAHYGVHHWGYWPYALIALAISWGLAWLSWHGIEKRALAIKSWGPGKGLAHWWSRVRSLRNPQVA